MSVRVTPSQRSLYSFVVDHAHAAIRKVWIAYFDDRNDCELESLSMTFWRWEPASTHPDIDGARRNAHIDEVVFDTSISRNRLIIKVRNHPDVEPCYYRVVQLETVRQALDALYTAE